MHTKGVLVVLACTLTLHLFAGAPTREAEDGSLPMHLAASGGFAEVVALLLDRGGSEQLSCRNRCGQRPEEVCMDYATSQVFANHTQGGSDWGRSNKVDGNSFSQLAE